MSFRIASASVATLFFVALSVASSDAHADGSYGALDSTSSLDTAFVGPLVPRLSLDGDSASAAPATDMVPYSVPMRTTGQVLTIIGGAHLVGGAIATTAFLGDGDILFTVLVGLPLLGSGAVITAIGIPLWAVGDHDVDPVAHQRASAFVPRLHVGLGQVMVTGAF